MGGFGNAARWSAKMGQLGEYLGGNGGSRAGRVDSRFVGPFPKKHYPPDMEIEPTHISICMNLDIDAHTASAQVTTTVEGRGTGSRRLVLHAVDFQNLEVTGGGKKLEYRYDGKEIEVLWDEPFAQGETRKITVSYKLDHPSSGLYFMKPDKEYPNRGYYAATDNETERARHWLPCVDLPEVRTTLDFALTAREDLTILANGILKNETSHKNGTKTAVWELAQRCPSYLICFAIGDFVKADDGEFEGRPLAYYTSRDFTSEDLLRSFGRSRPMMEWMTKRLGVAFPYPKYYQFALPAFGGAMENISLVSWSDLFVLDEELGPELVWLVDQVNVHEMAHSYFGDLVVCRDFAHAWLKESWATYIETCWLETKNQEEVHYDLYRNARAYFSEADESYKRPLMTREFSSSWQMYDRHLYPGGACRLHTLRSELGEEVFWPAVTDYLQTYSEKVVETEDFRKIMESHSGRSLGKWFDQWVYTAGYPDLKVTFDYDQDQQLGTFTVTQKQVKGGGEENSGKSSDGEPGIPAFELRTSLGWTIGGKDYHQDIVLRDERQSFTIPMKAKPEVVRFDPEWKALHKLEFNPGDDMLKAQLVKVDGRNGNVCGRIFAAYELCKTGRYHCIKAVVDAYDGEQFWGVRCEFVAALAKAGTRQAVDALASIALSEKDPMVLPEVFSALKKFRSPEVAQAIRQRLDVADLGPYATGRAYAALGAQRIDKEEEADRQRLLEAAHRDEPKYFFRTDGAVQGLANSKSSRAALAVCGLMTYGAMPYKARGLAAASLGSMATYLRDKERDQVGSTLNNLLRDKDQFVGMRAAFGLIGGRMSEYGDEIRQFANTLSHQDMVTLEGRLRKIEGDTGGSAVLKLESQVDDLKTYIRDLEERLVKVEGRADVESPPR